MIMLRGVDQDTTVENTAPSSRSLDIYSVADAHVIMLIFINPIAGTVPKDSSRLAWNGNTFFNEARGYGWCEPQVIQCKFIRVTGTVGRMCLLIYVGFLFNFFTPFLICFGDPTVSVKLSYCSIRSFVFGWSVKDFYTVWLSLEYHKHSD